MKRVIKYLLIIILIGIIYIFAINAYVVIKTKNNIIETVETKYEAIVVLGCAVWGNKPSPMLQDRLDTAIKLYEEGAAPKIIMSGDHTRENHDEVNIMKNYAVSKGVPSEDVFMDHAGISTYDSIYRVKYIFNLENILIVTQKYHLFRSLYISQKFEIKADGISANPRKYTNATYREIREVLARNKDYIKTIIKPPAKVMGETISVMGSGDITNDK